MRIASIVTLVALAILASANVFLGHPETSVYLGVIFLFLLFSMLAGTAEERRNRR